jgi:hypothetical protein
MRYSLFVHTYSLLERTLLGLAEHIQHAQKLDLSPNDLRDEGIVRAKTYLKKVARIPFPDTAPAWQEILTLNRIRNLVVHNTGYLPEDYSRKPELDALIARWSGDVALDHFGRFSFSSGFVPRVIDACRAFLDELLRSLGERS